MGLCSVEKLKDGRGEGFGVCVFTNTTADKTWRVLAIPEVRENKLDITRLASNNSTWSEIDVQGKSSFNIGKTRMRILIVEDDARTASFIL